MEESKILVLAERAGGAQLALQRASILARHLDASIELFACDSEHAWAVTQRLSDPSANRVIERCLASSARYLEALRGSVAARDLHIGINVACAASIAEGVTTCISELAPLLVVHGLAEGCCRDGRWELPPELRQLLRRVSAPLLLTRGVPWAPVPRIIVSEDLDFPDEAARTKNVGIAERLCRQCYGRFIVWPGRVEEARSLSEFVRAAAADVLIINVPPQDQWEATRGRALEAMLGAVTCDVLLMPSFASAHGFVTPAVAFRTNSA